MQNSSYPEGVGIVPRFDPKTGRLYPAGMIARGCHALPGKHEFRNVKTKQIQ
jgi:hypothetical protein